jgi:DNA-binding MarR family transcriptional regulator
MLAHCHHALLHSSTVFECLPARLNIETPPVMAKQKKKNRQPELSRALNAVRRMVRGLRSAAEAIERELSVSAAQLFVLMALGDAPDQSVKDLAAVTMTTHSTVSQVVSQLIAKGLVTRTSDASDRRRAVLRLTRQGANLVKRSPRVIQADLIKGFGALRPAERRGLANGLEKWLDASGMARVQPRMLFDKPLLDKGRSRSRSGSEPSKGS